MSENLILGIDPSLTSSGWAILNLEQKTCIDWGVIKTTPEDLILFRFLAIRKTLSDLIQKYNIKQVGCEAPVFGGYETGTAYALYIMLLEIMYKSKTDIVFLAPMQIQKIVKSEGFGTAGKIFKSDSVQAAEVFLGGKVPNKTTGDKADAFHAARIGARFWLLFSKQIQEVDLSNAEQEIFAFSHTYTRGAKKGFTERKGLIYRENDLFFRFSTYEHKE